MILKNKNWGEYCKQKKQLKVAGGKSKQKETEEEDDIKDKKKQ